MPNASKCLDRKFVECRANRNLDANAFPRIQIGLRNVAAAQWPGKEAKHIRTAGYCRKQLKMTYSNLSKCKKVTNTEVSYQFVLTSTENMCLINNSNFHFCVRHPLNTAMEGKQKAGETKSMGRSLVLISNIRSRE